MHSDIQEIVFSEEEIQKKVRELAALVQADYIGKELCIITILRGASVFLADFTRCLDRLNFTIDFLVLTRGPGGKSSEVKIVKDLDYPIYQKNILIVEDMIDMGESLYYVKQLLTLRAPASIKICTLFEKPIHRTLPIKSDYTGFILPDTFVVGYGLDYRQRYRNLPYAGILKPSLCH